MTWLSRNINHFPMPLGILLNLSSVSVAYRNRRRQKAGLAHPSSSKTTIALICLMVVYCLSMIFARP